MDWTIVVSVLVALLLWLVVLGSFGALMILSAATVFRGRSERLMETAMDHCKQMFNSRESVTRAGTPAELDSCHGAEVTEAIVAPVSGRLGTRVPPGGNGS